MMSTSTLLFLIASGQFLLSVQGLTLRLKGKEIIPDGGNVSITDLLVKGGCRSYETIECLSDMPYQGIFEKAYWVYTDEDHLVDNIRCKGDECKNPDIGWQSSRGIYRKGKRYYNAVRLGRTKKNAAVGKFTCYFEGESPVSVNIMIDCSVLTAPIEIRVANFAVIDNTEVTTISWNPPCGGVDKYTFYYTNGRGRICNNETLDANIESYKIELVDQIQIAAHRNDTTKCSKVQEITFGNYTLLQKDEFDNGCTCEEE